MPTRLSRKGLIVAVVLAVVVRVGAQLYRENRVENRRLQRLQETQLQEQKFQAQKQAASQMDKEQVKAELQSNPSKLLIGGTSVNVFRRELFTTYSHVTAILVANISPLDVADLSGELTYVNDSGKEIATVPFTAEGDVRAGQTMKLKITAAEVKGKAPQGHIVVNNVRIIVASNQ
jgi:hypothetical protein